MVAEGSGAPHPFAHPPGASMGPVVAPQALGDLLLGNSPPVLVDLREGRDRRYGHLPDDRSIPLAEIFDRAGELPKGRRIILYDHLGDLAPHAAGAVRARTGLAVEALEGGFDAYARLVDPSLGRYRGADDPTVVFQLPRPESGCLAYLAADLEARTAILIDPGIDVAPYVERLRTSEWKLAAIVETHTHADHLAGHAELHRRTSAPVYVSHRSPAAYPHRALTAGEEIRAGALALRTHETPGHTMDHLTLQLGSRIFTGDTLLIGGCGRTDLGGGDPLLLFDSLHRVLGGLPDATEVYPAHYGPKHALPARYVTTLGLERADNEALRIAAEPEFVKYMTEGWPPKPANFDAIVAANLADEPAA